MNNPPLLELQEVSKEFSQTTSVISSLMNLAWGIDESGVTAVDKVNLEVLEGEVHGIIGESGCGKTTLLKIIAGLHSPTRGDIRFRGDDISQFDKSAWKKYRSEVQMIFQDPFNSLDPKYTVAETLAEPLKIHGEQDIHKRIVEVLEEVKLDPPERYMDRLPRELSGGEKQRVAIARALILNPKLILADEPVSMLDVSTQAAILQDLEEIANNLDVAMVYISHDVSTVSYVCDVVNVMYLGRIVERAKTSELITNPQHPYTKAMISAVPIPDPFFEREPTKLEGRPGDATNLGEGCRFKDRCTERMDVCDITPAFVNTEGDARHQVACHLCYDHHEMMDQSRDGVKGVSEVAVGDAIHE